MIPYGRQDIDQADIDAVVGILKSDFLTQGPAIGRFERSLTEWCRTRHAVAMSSATAALHAACLALDIGPGDLVWTSPITFVASANCALYCGAEVDFVDIDPATYTLSIEALTAKLELADRRGRLPKLVIPVHMAGQPCDMAAIALLSRRFGFRVLEDASHAIGAWHEDGPVGNCRYSDITVFSFHPVKIITTAEGGAALTNDDGLAERMALFRSHGITRAPEQMEGTSHGPWYYQQLELGWNYRMTDLQAALGASQMRRLESLVAARRAIAARYDDAFATLPIIRPFQQSNVRSSFHLYIVALPSRDPRRRRHIFDALRDRGVGANVHYIPVYLQPYFQRLGFAAGLCPVAEDYYDRAISIPLHPRLSADDQQRVIAAVAECVRT